ncbi:LemA family protein [Terriglobus sp. TAA 43]|uniref:LemA family protein n=1 Tax=Terriglobus sp. TAA 43 TaxID=278961 RepID=UPI0006486125|nr:LemA family protein [Terriglobus sp. TAA 43]
MKKGLIGIIVLVVLVGLVGMSYISARNSMAVKSNQVDAAFSAIDVDLQRRADLIPNLVASVKGYAKVETDVLTKIAEARSGLLQARTPDEKLAANDRLSTAILPLTRMQEAYPDLKSNQQFMRLEDELSGTENRIAVTRKRYNDAILDYNNTIAVFPNSLWASIGGFKPKTTYYQADPGSKSAPKVDFGS